MNKTTIEQPFETVIGLEVHLQFNTKTKIFCGCPNKFGEAPNSSACPVCLGLPGTLPVLNHQVLQYAIRVGLALNCEINTFIKFDRKNYYYPDLPKGYQISQYDFPIAKKGFINIPSGSGLKKVRINRAHMEEDAGKLIHDDKAKCSLVDYNRTGTPLLEIVTEPDLCSPQEAYDYLTKLKLIFQYLEVSDCDMEKGSLRCDANISLRKKGETKLGTKAELKNLNSFKAVRLGLEFEETRQAELLKAGKAITQETRLWDEHKRMTVSMRTKEHAHDYRYFPDPDLVSFTLNKEEIETIKKALPESPDKKLERFMKDYRLTEYDATIIVQDKTVANFFEESAKLFRDTKKICNWMNVVLQKELNSRKLKISEINLKPQQLTDIIIKVEEGLISHLAGKDILTLVIDTGKSPDEIIKDKGLLQVSDDAMLEKMIDEVITENEKAVIQFKEGKENAFGFLVGQTMKKSNGKADPKKAGEILKRRLHS